mgnify:CR=1 FL=1|tara:strand:- start:153 stop:689 length:537 start_codon:yes stop_codon:yes gene_type:complete
MTFSYDEFMEDMSANKMWPNNFPVDFHKVYELAKNLHETIESSINKKQQLLEGLVLMDWLTSVAQMNYNALRQQVFGRLSDKESMEEVGEVILNSRSMPEIEINLEDFFGDNGNMPEGLEQMLDELGNAIHEAMGKVKSTEEQVIEMIDSSEQEIGSQESFEKILKALKNAVLPNEEE